jgi:protein transport protein SEC20
MSWAAQRAKLFARNEGAAGKGKERLKKTTEELVVSKSEEVTTALREMHRLAQAEALKSHLTVDELEYSSHSLRELEHKYGAYDVVLHGARRMVKHIQEADAADRRNMILSLTFLATVVAWIIWRRIVRRPVMLILWTIAKLLGIVKVVSKPFSPADTVNATNDLTVAATTAIIGAVVHAVTESVSIAATASYASETLFPIEPSIETDDVEESVLDTTATVIHDDL